jgi:8-oxo-dGTP diphosphatase
MRERSRPSAARASGAPAIVSLDLVCCAAAGRHLAVLVRSGGRASTTMLPWTAPDPAAAIDAAAARFAREQLGRAPVWIAQVGASGDGRRHPSGAPLSVCYVAVLPAGTAAPEGMEWVAAADLTGLAPRQQAMVPAAVAALRDRMDIAPIAFRMLAPEFTLSELQQVYELLLGRRLHKASFRRALQGAYLVEPTGSWRSEGRGRPAQLFRYAPRKRRGVRRSVRFELLG